ncbi:uncharacterized protein [Amphiura filiformis]|uniref:uncharacterized protein n=1 Tax=Amphiura filiformis TaxID=82378 RepID=UPI003B21E9BE
MAEGINPSEGSRVKHDKIALFKLIATNRLPLVAKVANTTVSCRNDAGRLVVGESYRLQHLLYVPKVTLRVLHSTRRNEGNSSVSDEGKPPLELSIPKDYQGPFQVLPFDTDMSEDMDVTDVIKFMPKFIKVVKVDPNKRRSRISDVQLSVGDTLKVLGASAPRLTRKGIQPFLSLQKNHREFALSPDFKGQFQAIEVDKYKIAQILEKFSLPQKIFIVKPEEHSKTLLSILPSINRRGTGSFLAKREGVDEYVSGVDMSGQNAVIIHVDAAVEFCSPPLNVKIVNNQLQTTGTDLIVDQVIREESDQLVICKPWEQVFRDPPPILAIQRPHQSTEDNAVRAFNDEGNDERLSEASLNSDGYLKIPCELVDDASTDDNISIDSGSDGYERIPPLYRDQSAEDNASVTVNDEGNDERFSEASLDSEGYLKIPCELVDDSSKDDNISIDSGSDGYERIPPLYLGQSAEDNALGAVNDERNDERFSEASLDSYGYKKKMLLDDASSDDNISIDSGSDGYERIPALYRSADSVNKDALPKESKSEQVTVKQIDPKYGEGSSSVIQSGFSDYSSTYNIHASKDNSSGKPKLSAKPKIPSKPKLPLRTLSIQGHEEASELSEEEQTIIKTHKTDDEKEMYLQKHQPHAERVTSTSEDSCCTTGERDIFC